MKKIFALLILLFMSGIAVAQNDTKDDMDNRLRKAIVEEEANQDLDNAIAAYRDILKLYDENRVTAATALFHLADCYRKQGEKESAIDAYKRVVSEFPEQTKLAAASQDYLASVYYIQLEQDSMAELQARLQRNIEARRTQEQERAEAQRQEAAIQAAYQDARAVAEKLEKEMNRVNLETAHKKYELIRQKIELVEREISEAKASIDSGLRDPSEVYPLQKELLSLQEELADMEHQMRLYEIQN